jgi:hypothetical protein
MRQLIRQERTSRPILTLLYASQTTHLEMTNGFSFGFGLFTGSSHFSVVDHRTSPDSPPPSLDFEGEEIFPSDQLDWSRLWAQSRISHSTAAKVLASYLPIQPRLLFSGVWTTKTGWRG